MKILTISALALLLLTTTVSAQKSGLINSGKVIQEGITLYDSTHYKQALTAYNKINRNDTNYVRALYEKALTCLADSQYTLGIKYCQEGLSLKAQRSYEPDFYNVYGSLLNDSKQYDQALKVYDVGISKYPLYSSLFFNKGLTYFQTERYHDAELQFQKALLINPYMYSAHYQLALSAIRQGKVVPAFLSATGYLLMAPNGRYASKAINMLSLIGKGDDEVIEFKNKRKDAPDANYQMVEEILLSKIALDRQYKPLISLDDAISRQIQVVFEKLEYDPKNNDFWIQYYLPYYQQVFKNGKFENFIYHGFSGVNIPAIQSYNKKNKKELDVFLNEAGNYFNDIRATQQLMLSNRDTVKNRYVYEEGKILGKGQLVNGKTLVGPWRFYYPAGNLKSFGMYNQTGAREGIWQYFSETGVLTAKETHVNGKLNGDQYYYYDNGNLSSHELSVNGELDGPAVTYYYAGAKKMDATYKGGKKIGEEKTYYDNGHLKAIHTYTADALNGPAKIYHKSGGIKEAGQYTNGKTEGPYKLYNEAGDLTTETLFTGDKVNGEWKAYYNNGKIKEKRNYIDDLEDGKREEYYENGQLSASYGAKKGKLNGEAISYDKAGKIYSKTLYDNAAIKSIAYFDGAGKQYAGSALKSNAIDMVIYTNKGVKSAHFKLDQKGNYTGADTVFFSSGRIKSITQYANNEANGPSVAYHLNGKKKTEVNFTDGKEDGYYQSYYPNGQLETEGWLQKGENQGEWLSYDVTGKLSARSYYLDSELNGYREEYTPNGNKTLEQRYANGKLELMTQYDDAGKVIAVDSFYNGSGKYTLLYPNKKVMAQGNYVNGNLDGAYKTFYIDGTVSSSYFYKGGALDSTYTTYFHGGVKHLEGHYKRGNKTGIWNTYNEDGKLTLLATYRNDELNGDRIYYNEDGSKDYVSVYKNDDIDGVSKKYDADGTLAYESVFEDGDIVSYSYLGKDGKPVPSIPVINYSGEFKSYYANGKPSRECVYLDGVRNGAIITYYNNGQMRTHDTELYGVSNGVSKSYYADGKLKSETPYAVDELNGTAKEYYQSGVLKSEKNYLYGYSHGDDKYYDEKGTLKKTITYSYGKTVSIK